MMIPCLPWSISTLLVLAGWTHSYWSCDQVGVITEGAQYELFTIPGELVFEYRTEALWREGLYVNAVPRSEWLLDFDMIHGVDGMSGIAYRKRPIQGRALGNPKASHIVMVPFWLVLVPAPSH